MHNTLNEKENKYFRNENAHMKSSHSLDRPYYWLEHRKKSVDELKYRSEETIWKLQKRDKEMKNIRQKLRYRG